MRSRWGRVATSVVVAWGLLSTTSALARKPPPSCATRLISVLKTRVKGWVAFVAIAGVVAPPTVDQVLQHSLHHDVVAAVSGDTHLGHGIYFGEQDWADVMESLTPGERALVDNAASNPVAVVDLFTRRVAGDYDDSRIAPTELQPGDPEPTRRYVDYVRGERASYFVLATGKPRGVCSHKAVVLAAFLRRAGIDARVEHAMTTDDVGHAYVVIRPLSLIADPTLEEVTPEKYYRQRHVKFVMDYWGNKQS